jgi:flagellar biosynthetic protein FlhB
MADESSGQEKTEDPTERRLTEARNKGDVLKSMEIPSAAVLIAGLMGLYMMRGYMYTNLLDIMRFYFSQLHTMSVVPANMLHITMDCMYFFALLLLPLMGLIFITAALANYAQVGVIFTTEKLMPKYEKIDPIKGIARMFSMQTLNNTLKSIAKITVITWAAYTVIKAHLNELLPLMQQEPISIFVFYCKISFLIFLKAAIVIALLAVIDWVFQRWEFMKKMRMTKQEMKEEAKSTEGDPHVKGRIRSIQMEMARKRMMADVPDADVIITNPTRLAIAIKYDSASMVAPIVVAKGAGVIAHKIKEIGRDNNVPLVEDKPLARAIYAAVEIGDPIPAELFQAVAEILAHVYGLKAA